MKVKDLIIKLQRVLEVKPDATAYLEVADYFDFTGFGVDDNNDVQLYIVAGDEKA